MGSIQKRCQNITRWTWAKTAYHPLSRVGRDFYVRSRLIPDRSEDIPQRGVTSDDYQLAILK